jgi:SUMO ligase MMS21 Smc5/6 complex component
MAPAEVKVTNGNKKCVASPAIAVVRAKNTDNAAKTCDLLRIDKYVWKATSNNRITMDVALSGTTGEAEKKCNLRVI